MGRVEVFEECTLYLADCMDVLPALDQADAVVTDPPYGTAVTEWDDSISEEAIAAVLDAARNYSAFFYSNTRLGHLLTAIRSSGRDAWTAVWHKTNAMGFERRFAPQWVPMVIAYRGNPRFFGKDYCAYPIVPQNVDHPTPKPLGVTRWLVDRASIAGNTVLNPYMGSGTTGVACVMGGRKFIGIERDAGYFETACRRIEEAARQPRLFMEPDQKTRQPALF